MRRLYVHERKDWPNFHWAIEKLADPRLCRYRQGGLIGQMKGLGFRLQQEAVLETLTKDVLKTSEIEGEKLDAEQVRSSVARRLGLDIGGFKPADCNVEGVVEMMLDATGHYDRPLTHKRLFRLACRVVPDRTQRHDEDQNGSLARRKRRTHASCLRRHRKRKVHFEAPKADRLKKEMTAFLKWFESKDVTDPVLRADLAHLWFVTIHPFEDGNGRIARAITDMALARSEHSSQLFYSMSAQIKLEHKEYYDILESTQKGSMDVTEWMFWFLDCLGRAIDGAHLTLRAVVDKARFWERIKDVQLNERQRSLINRLLDGFEDKLTSSKYAKLTKCSQDTAHRDIQALIERGVLVQNPEGGRSTSYSLAPVK